MPIINPKINKVTITYNAFTTQQQKMGSIINRLPKCREVYRRRSRIFKTNHTMLKTIFINIFAFFKLFIKKDNIHVFQI
jgi:predicted RNA-binding protein